MTGCIGEVMDINTRLEKLVIDETAAGWDWIRGCQQQQALLEEQHKATDRLNSARLKSGLAQVFKQGEQTFCNHLDIPRTNF